MNILINVSQILSDHYLLMHEYFTFMYRKTEKNEMVQVKI